MSLWNVSFAYLSTDCIKKTSLPHFLVLPNSLIGVFIIATKTGMVVSPGGST